MTFPRAIIIAIMAKMLMQASGFLDQLTVFAVGGVLWLFTADPLPTAIKRGLEEFAREYRR